MSAYIDPLEGERPTGVPADAEAVELHFADDVVYTADVYRYYDVWCAVAIDNRRDQKWVAIAETRELAISELHASVQDAIA